jgi:acyl dehydratase
VPKTTLCYNDIVKGQKFQDYTYALTEEAIIKYCDAVEEDAQVFRKHEIAKNEGYPTLAAPPTTAESYILKGFLREAEMPSGSFHESQEFEFVHPALAGDIITAKSYVADKFELNGRKHIVIEVNAFNQSAQLIVKSRIDSVWTA